jgi:hypothetical protein
MNERKGMFDFEFLRQQVEEGLIVEDPETLAAIALLVPDLVTAHERTSAICGTVGHAIQTVETESRRL